MTMDSEAAGAGETYDELHVSPTCFVQTAESRFGAEVLDDLKSFVQEALYAIDVDIEVELNDEDEVAELQALEDMGVDIAEFEDWSGMVLFNNDQFHAQHGFPRIAPTRNNLTALSQRYNLYFAAYQDRIYVYQPRRAVSRILPNPSLILHTRPTKAAESCGGALDQRFPHQINHIIVGNLGDLEIVLFAYDDGDVAAYYTHSIVRCTKANSDLTREPGSSPSRHAAHPKPLFHENVGKSAWGLAIHEQSRLIAVSSNNHEVVVFAFALSQNTVPVKFPETDDSPLLACGQTAFELQKHFQARTRTWKIILPVSRGGNNMPNIDIISDDAGEAEKVVAIDIYGTVWLLDIWKIGAQPVRWPDAHQREQQTMHGVKGWGVLVLPYNNFKQTATVREALGVPANEVIAGTRSDEDPTRVWLDTTCSLYYVKGFPSNPEQLFRQRRSRYDYVKTHAMKPECQEEDLSDAWETEVDSDVDLDATLPDTVEGDLVCYPPTAASANGQWTTIIPFSGSPTSSLEDLSDETQLMRAIVPSFGEMPKLDANLAPVFSNRPYGDRWRRTKPVEFISTELPAHYRNDFCLFRTTLTDVELQPFDRGSPCIECNCLLVNPNQAGADQLPWDLQSVYAQRVSMLAHVPELNLVVAGSPTGRVALFTLTKTAKRVHLSRVRYGFRVECVLPRKAEEEKKLRPVCPLIGVAVSPVPVRGAKGLELRPRSGSGEASGREAAAGVVYRLMIHYKDHSILMYEISRGRDKELLVF